MIERFVATLLVAAALGVVRTADAASDRPLVVLVRPSSGNRSVSEALIRINGELVEGGFDVAVVEAIAGANPSTTIEQAGKELAPAVTVGIFGDARTSLELWIADRLTGKMVVRKLDASGESGSRASEVLAIRTAELLRASLMELLVRRNPKTEAASAGGSNNAGAPPAVSHWAAKGLEPSPPSSRLGFELGASGIGSFEGLGPALVPVVRARIAWTNRFHMRATAAGLGTRAVVTGTVGTASVRQDLVLLEAAYRLSSTPFRPQFSLGAGGYHVGVEGHAMWPYQGMESERWSIAFDAGVGCALPLHSYVEASLELHALVATPSPLVRLFDEVAAYTGRPTWMVVLTLAGWL